MALVPLIIRWGADTSSDLRTNGDRPSDATKIGMANLVYNIKRLIFLRNLAIA
jgi:hypothetical protein